MSQRARIRNRRRALWLLFAVVAAAAIGSFALADTGTQTTNIQGTGIGSTGQAVDLATDSVSFTRPNGAASLQAGLQMAHVTIAKGYAGQIKLDAAWLNPQDASQVLNNPNATIWVGLYHPLYQGNCTPTNPSEDDTLATMTYNAVDYCVALDDTARGTTMSSGKLVLSRTVVSGFVRASVGDPSSPAPCTTTPQSTSISGGVDQNWCQPAGVDSSANVFFVGVSIVTPGGKPAGQQNNLDELKFYFGSRLLLG